MEGNGPSGGTVRHTGCLIASRSPFCLDLFLSRLIALKPQQAPTVLHSIRRGLCPDDPSMLRVLNPDSLPLTIPDFVHPQSKTVDFSGNLPPFLRPAVQKAAKLLSPRPVIDPERCIGCGKCREAKRCVFDDDPVNEAIEKARACDGFIFGSPVYYASPNGAALAFLDRLFYAGGSALRYKPGAAVVSARRGGTTAALDALNKYFTINCMPVVSSQYWNMVHGNTPEEVVQDKEGLQIMRTLGNNMAWLLHCIQAGKEQGIALPEREPKEKTNFIR